MRNIAAFNGITVQKGRSLALAAAVTVAGLVWMPAGFGQPAGGIEELRARAGQSDPEAQNALGNAYTNAQLGLPRDYAEALKWYQRAAEKGYAAAQFNLGLAYELGRGVAADETVAFRHYLRAAEQGFAAAQFNVGNMYAAGRGVPQDLFEANVWYKQAAENGVAEAQFNLGLAYESGRGIKRDEAQAARWYRQAAERGLASAQYNLGLLLEDGRGLAKDEAQAARLYRSSAEQGFAPAQNNYGLMVSEGRGGVTRDPVEAYVWLSLAAANGSNPAARDFVGKSLTSQQRDAARRRLAERGIVPDLPAAGSTPEHGLEPLRASLSLLQQQVQALQAEKAELEKWAQSLERTVNEKSAALEVARMAATGKDAVPASDELRRQLAEANRALGRSEASVAELTAENDRLEQALSAARRTGDQAAGAQRELEKARADAAGLAALREENARLRSAAAEHEARRGQGEQLAREVARLNGLVSGSRSELGQAQARVAELEKQLEEARTIRTRSGDDTRKLEAEAVEARQAIEKLNATVAELTEANDRLEKDLENSQKSAEAALAAQSQAVSATEPDAYKVEISTLQARVKQLEGQLEDDRSSTAREVATLASQLQRARESNKALTDANRALLNAQQAEAPMVQKDEYDRLETQVRDLKVVGDELRRQNQKLTDDNQRLSSEKEALKVQLDDAAKVASLLPGLSDEKSSLQERLEAVGTQLVRTQGELDALQKEHGQTLAQLAESRRAAEKAQTELAGLQGRADQAEKTAEAHTASVAELTGANTALEAEREDLKRQLAAARAEAARLGEMAGNLERLRADAERGAQQNVEALSAQLAQTRRDLQGARDAHARLLESSAAQERERAATLAQLRQQNSALAARLTQAQGTLDQIAAAARLGTPAAAIATGGAAPTRPTPQPAQPEARIHTVTDGDSLSRISLRYYGTANRWQEIYQANREVLQGSNALRVGQQLRIP
ncbi:MAG: SEL1-like repeat protein [Opitutaceae bacterium]|nr:SEL1-like repeat protein [Opitutaceae bacterium]